MKTSAILSSCRTYRYALTRRWAEGPACLFVGLNPSTADETIDDPTIRRCIGFAQSWGFGKLYMLNLFAFRATQPVDMQKAVDPVGPDNDYFLSIIAQGSSLCVAAWGAGGSFRQRDQEVKKLLPQLHYLRLTKEGYPGHPLYLPKDLKPLLWSEQGGLK